MSNPTKIQLQLLLQELQKENASLRRAIDSLRVSEEQIHRLSQAIEQSPVSIVITDLAGTIEYANPKFCEVTGYAYDEIIGKNPRILKSGELSDEAYRDMWQTISSGREWRGEFHNRKKNGELFWELASISPIIDDEGTITSYLAVKEDITERKRAEREIIAAKDLAEHSDLLKDAYIANISHEIRTPLNVII